MKIRAARAMRAFNLPAPPIGWDRCRECRRNRMSASAPTLFHKSRLEALSDGVFAIVMTLLVLDLRGDFVRAITENNHQTWLALVALRHALLTYAVTFVLSGMFWIHQSRMLHLLTHTTVRHAWLTLLFLFWVTLLPLTFAVGTHTFTGLIIYLGNMSLIALSLLIGWLDARWSRLIADENLRLHTALTLRISTLAAGCAAAMLATVFTPDWGWTAIVAIALPGRIVAGKVGASTT
jgi:uncharacterized membrane protein